MSLGASAVARNSAREHLEIGRVPEQFERGVRAAGGPGGVGRAHPRLQNRPGARYFGNK